MKTFDFYEFAGEVVPGAILLTGLALIYPDVQEIINLKGFDVGDLGLFVILAYAAGVLVQGLGVLVAWIWWRIRGGRPSDWVRSGRHPLLADEQMVVLKNCLAKQLKLSLPTNLQEMSERDWFSVTRQVYAAVAAQGKGMRVDTFNGNYGLGRGVAAALIVVTSALFINDPRHIPDHTGVIIALLIAIGFAIARMQRFGKHYARELFVQFLQLSNNAVAGNTRERD